MSAGARTADVLEVIADLSNDEVFTPPDVVTRTLDLLPPEVWGDPTLRWLDPGCKTGVFLREVVKRLLVGLEPAIPDRDARLDHILTDMVFGIGITELTSLLARRTLYGSKTADGPASVHRMPTAMGNVWFGSTQHTFDGKGRCVECGAPSSIERESLENFAYPFIHHDGRRQIEKVLPMKFDVILGNPPYQMGTGQESAQATPLYHRFVQTAMDLEPRYILMIVPTRWMVGGMGLGDFRKRMLADKRMHTLVDFPNATEVFPSVSIKGGVCYFLWDAAHDGRCRVRTMRDGKVIDDVERDLGEFDVFVRSDASAKILRKVLAHGEPSAIDLVSSQKPYGLPTNAQSTNTDGKGVPIVSVSGGKRRTIHVNVTHVVETGVPLKSWKILVPKAGSDGGQKLPDPVLGRAEIAPPGVGCTESFVAIGPFASEKEATNFETYLNTRFFRFLVSLRKVTQDSLRNVYAWVPVQPINRPWTDDELFDKYGLTPEEREHVTAFVK